MRPERLISHLHRAARQRRLVSAGQQIPPDSSRSTRGYLGQASADTPSDGDGSCVLRHLGRVPGRRARGFFAPLLLLACMEGLDTSGFNTSAIALSLTAEAHQSCRRIAGRE